MGVGKTTLIKELLSLMSVIDNVSSPTFSIINEYSTDKDEIIYHMDLYRINDSSELESIGLEEYLNEPNAIIFIEWPENSFGYLKKFNMKISLQHLSRSERKCSVELNP